MIRSMEPEQIPMLGGITGLAHGDQQAASRQKVARGGIYVDLQERHEKPVCGRIVEAARIRSEIPEYTRCPVDLRLQAEELVQSSWPGQQCAITFVVDGERGIHGLQRECVAHAEALIGRLKAELGVHECPGSRKALVTVIQVVETEEVRV